jgi:hypothetical protein
MSNHNMKEKWQDFEASLAVQVMSGAWIEKLAAFGTRGLTNTSPKWRIWLRLLFLFAIAAVVILAAGVCEWAGQQLVTGHRFIVAPA